MRSSSLPVRFVRSTSPPLHRKGFVKKIHIARDSRDYEYSLALCGTRTDSAWDRVGAQEATARLDGPEFCTGCRKILAGTLKKKGQMVS